MSTILLVDDAMTCREATAAMLRLKGFTVLTATSGAEGLKLLKEYPVDLMVLDLAMPGIDGMQMLSELRADPQFVSLPVIVFSAVIEHEYLKQVHRLGISDHLVKSRASLADLVIAVERHLPQAVECTANSVP